MRNTDTYLKNKEYVAKFLGVSIGTIDRMVMTRTGPRFVKVGNLVRFRPEDLAIFVEANSRGGQSVNAGEVSGVPA
jgi:excisionase family DNA binding protein